MKPLILVGLHSWDAVSSPERQISSLSPGNHYTNALIYNFIGQSMSGSSPENYAVLFSSGGRVSGNNSRYYGSLKSLYRVLVEQRGLDPENIVILYADGDSEKPNQNIDGSVDDGNLASEFGYLEKLFDDANIGESSIRLLWEMIANVSLKDDDKFIFSEREARHIENLKRRLEKADGSIKLDSTTAPAQDGRGYLVKGRVFVTSDLEFARGSTILPATPDSLEKVFLGGKSPLADMTDRDHLLFWTFDHGAWNSHEPSAYLNLDGQILSQQEYDDNSIDSWGNPASGNLAVLTGWGNDIWNEDLDAWISPSVNRAGHTTLIYNQCFSGGMLEASRELLTSAENAYGMAATNPYEVSYNYDFAESVKQVIAAGNPLAQDLFTQAKARDKKAVSDPYPANGGQGRVPGKEHPWAYGGTDGQFKVFADDTSESTDLGRPELVFDDRLASAYGGDLIALDLKEDQSLDLLSILSQQLGEIEITAITFPAEGILAGTSGLVYTPTYDFNGLDSLFVEYRLAGGASSSVVKVSLQVDSVNDAPVAVDDQVTLKAGDRSAIISLDDQPGFLDDYDNDFDALRIANYSSPENGRLKKTGPQTFKYIPDKGFKGDDSFLYVITDGELYSTAEVKISVGAGNFSHDNVYGTYELISDGADPVINPLRRADGSLITDDDSSRWNVIAAERDGNKYKLLLEGLDRREGFFRVWDASLDGDLLKKRGWLSADAMNEKGYDDLFARDFVTPNPL